MHIIFVGNYFEKLFKNDNGSGRIGIIYLLDL